MLLMLMLCLFKRELQCAVLYLCLLLPEILLFFALRFGSFIFCLTCHRRGVPVSMYVPKLGVWVPTICTSCSTVESIPDSSPFSICKSTKHDGHHDNPLHFLLVINPPPLKIIIRLYALQRPRPSRLTPYGSRRRRRLPLACLFSLI